jgi:hypothetical protein
MYLKFYGLREAPFSPTPDPKFLFQSARHREALAQLVYGVRERKGFIVLTGEIGTGKTTLLRTLIERLDGTVPVAYVHNSALEIEGLLEYVLHDWGVKSMAASHAQRLVALNEFLIEQHRDGKSPLLVIDEAQNLSRPTLEAVRLLSNFETTSQKLMQILLVGQPELRDTLNSPAQAAHRPPLPHRAALTRGDAALHPSPAAHRRRGRRRHLHGCGDPEDRRVQPRHATRDQHRLRPLPAVGLRGFQAPHRREHGGRGDRVPRGGRAARVEAAARDPARAEPDGDVGRAGRRRRARVPARHHARVRGQRPRLARQRHSIGGRS